ncbi:MAG: GntR family transcriptional regulator [Phycisphaerae bacterium]|nr:GntR family transcriptional regulator [Phycisphaerae bacterium]
MKSMARENKSNFAYEEIRKKILARMIEPGERLVERAWAEKLSVNRADIRQALSRLVGEGLLVHGKKGGAFVPFPDPEREEEFLRARMAVEVGAALLAVKYATEKEIQELEKVVELMGDLAEYKLHTNFNEVDIHFHEVMVKAAHSPQLLDMYHRANFPLTSNKPAQYAEMMKQDTKKHDKILQALKKRNFPLLSKLLAEAYED